MAARIWSNNSDITLTCWKITNFNLSLSGATFVLNCFCRTSGLAFLLSLNFLFTRGYYVSTRVEIFSAWVEIFETFNSVYWGETSIRDENLNVINPLKIYYSKKSDICQDIELLVEMVIFWENWFFCYHGNCTKR